MSQEPYLNAKCYPQCEHIVRPMQRVILFKMISFGIVNCLHAEV